MAVEDTYLIQTEKLVKAYKGRKVVQEVEINVRRLDTDVFAIPLWAGLALLGLDVLFKQTRYRRLP